MKHLAALMLAATLAPAIAAGHDFHGRDSHGRNFDGRDRGQPGEYVRPQGGAYGAPTYRPDLGPGPERLLPPRDSPYGRREGAAAPGYYPPPPYGWRRGQVLGAPYQGEIISDYAFYHLRRPPRGYYWYRSDDDFVLAARASGLIFEVIPADGY